MQSSHKFEEYITVAEAAKLSKTSKPTIYRLINQGKLKAVSFTTKDGPVQFHNWRIPLSAWKEYMEGA